MTQNCLLWYLSTEILQLAAVFVITFDTAFSMEPTFDVPIVNVTVVRGQIALLPCSIDFLGKFKVAWLDEAIPLTFDDRRIVDDTRFSIIRPMIREWNLQIRDVRLDDQGQYRCTVNTSPVKSKMVMLHVKVPAEIIRESSSGDVTLQEGDTVVLKCNVTGIPSPQITWYRRPSTAMKYGHSNPDRTRVMEGTGESIVIRNVTRYSDDIHECVASNGVPPPAIHQIRVTVEFPPEIQLPNRRIGQSRNRETILECVITAFPLATSHWAKDGRRIPNSSKYRLEAYEDGEHRLTLSLKVHVANDDDFGEYICNASNLHGAAKQSMHLYEHHPETENPAIRKQAPDSTFSKNEQSTSWQPAGSSTTGNQLILPYRSANSTRLQPQGLINENGRPERIRYVPSESRQSNSVSYLVQESRSLTATASAAAAVLFYSCAFQHIFYDHYAPVSGRFS